MTLRTCGEREGIVPSYSIRKIILCICSVSAEQIQKIIKKRKDFQKQKPFYSEEDDNGFQNEMEVKKLEKDNDTE